MQPFIFPKRFSLVKTFSVTFLIFAFCVRLLLYILSFSHLDFSFFNSLKIIAIGFLFDLGSLSYFIAIYAIYLLIVPTKFHGKKLDRFLTKFAYGFFIFLITFSFLAEVPFWDEYRRRFNFIAVDYLLYTYEVLENIHQSFSLPLLIGIIVFITYISIRIAKKKKGYQHTFQNQDSFKTKLFPAVFCFVVLGVFHFNIKNTQAEIFSNINENELAKSGLYSFFAAYKSNELNYHDFYPTISEKQLYPNILKLIGIENEHLTGTAKSIQHYVKNKGAEKTPNVIFIGLESLDARFMKRFGNTKNMTPAIDSLAKKSIFFTKLYATGTRTIRAMEAITLSIPPTPGRSIIKRDNNDSLYTIGEVFKQKGYTRTFIYGGDSHFDNMTHYFSHNGFDIVDRRKSYRLKEDLPTHRTRIEDDQVSFENAWAVCDADVYNTLLKVVDAQHKSKQPFFNFVMTTSNHKPYTYPHGVVDIPSGKNREGAVKYADKTFEDFFRKAITKPWFKNTVFVIMADHCAYSAGRTELNIKNHHIPAYIFNLKNERPTEVNKLSSQIDIFPTLFGYLNWSYTSNIFGKDISKMTRKEERAFIGNHRKVGLLKNNQFLVLETNKTHSFYNWDKSTNTLKSTETDSLFLTEAITYYQAAFELFKNGGLKIPNKVVVKRTH
jgi:phosphoglycerol transferase MdoB-like AlkP superfamily enzyme